MHIMPPADGNASGKSGDALPKIKHRRRGEDSDWEERNCKMQIAKCKLQMGRESDSPSFFNLQFAFCNLHVAMFPPPEPSPAR
jgi:hypothetical protein